MTSSYSFHAKLWHIPEEAGWHFLTLPVDIAEDVRDDAGSLSKGFGSIRVSAEISGHTWQTSLFPDSKSGSYLLPVKKAVRDAARISAGDDVAVRFEVHGVD
ncbi:DUF1905 domain-containing protein [Arthrobacter sp. CDRTa11]|nr:DUF1905 domain-containing protein [Arthrobacter sp. CDRTa11]